MARAHIGYLVGYEATNVFRIWVPHLKRVFRTRDVRFDETVHYDPNEPHIHQELRESVEELIEVVQAPELEADAELEYPPRTDGYVPFTGPKITHTANKPASQSTESWEKQPEEGISHNVPGQFPTPEPTPTLTPATIQPDPAPETTSNDPTSQLNTELDHLFTTTSLSEPSHNDPPTTRQAVRPSQSVSADISTENIVEEPRRRQPNSRYGGMFGFSSQVSLLDGEFSTFQLSLQNATQPIPLTANSATVQPRIHRSKLPTAPRAWRNLAHHPHRDQFMTACGTELSKIRERGTYKEAILPPGQRATPLMWVFDYKFDDSGYLVKHKARLVVRGDLVPPNGKRTHSDTLAARTARVMFALMAYFDLDARHLDGVNAFLNSYLDEDEVIYCHFPEGFKQPGKVMRLLRALYGLPRSPYLWFQELSETLKGLGFKPILEDVCLLSNGRVLIFFYVDDIVILNRPEHRDEAADIVNKLQTKYEIRDLGDLQWFLNIRITRDRACHRVYLTQDAYIDKVVKLYSLKDGSRIYTPLSRDSSAYKPYEEQASALEIKSFQKRVGSLIYPAFMTRPDIAHAASLLARFMQNPSPFHSAEADRVICYLRDTKDLSLVYNGSMPSYASVFGAYSDAAYADDVTTRRSSEGYIFTLFGGPIDWKATRQSTVTTSTTEAELLALTHAAKEVYWWRRFFSQLGFNPGHELEIRCDNSMTTGLMSKQQPVITTKLRHIDIHQHWLRERVQSGELKVTWLSTNDMPADGLTKPLSRQKHEHFVELLGLKRCPLP